MAMLRKAICRSVALSRAPLKNQTSSNLRFINQRSSHLVYVGMSSSPSRLNQIQNHLNVNSKIEGQRTFSMSAKTSSGSSSNPSTSSSKRTGGGDDGNEPKVITTNNGSSTTILLNRPKALNAIDTEMVQLIDEGIDFAPVENHIVLRGKGRALCSGGDVLAVVNAANSEDPKVRQQALTFFKNEFELDYKIAMLDKQSKPRVMISIMDGITMGGGVGLSVKAPIRVATEKTMFAMPETGIGYWPDVGVTQDLARLDGKIGVYLGMTGARITGEEAYLVGLATHFLPSNSIEDALHRLSALKRNSSAEHIAGTLDEFSVDPFNKLAHANGEQILSKSCFVGPRRMALDYAFGQASVELVLSALQDLASVQTDSRTAKDLARQGISIESDGISDWAKSTLKTLSAKAPRSLKITFKAVKEARHHDIPTAFATDMRLATGFCDLGVGRDFYEGVTFTLTKDPSTGKRREGIANWDPKSVEEVNDDLIEKVFFGSLEDAKSAGMTMEVPKLQGLPTNLNESRSKKNSSNGIGPLGWEREHNRLALPSEAECEALREGSHPSAGDYQLQEDEIVQILQKSKADKPSVEFKVKEWLQRRQKTLK